MVRKNLINKLLTILDKNHISRNTDLFEYDIWLNDSYNENGESHLLKNIVKNNDNISLIVYPDLDEYDINDLSCEEISYIIECLK